MDEQPVIRDSTRQRLGLMTPEELGVTLEVTVTTLQTWRGLGQGPRWVKLGKSVFYRHSDVVDWINRSVVDDAQKAPEEELQEPVQSAEETVG